MQILLQILQNKKKNIENIFSHFQEEREKELLFNKTIQKKKKYFYCNSYLQTIKNERNLNKNNSYFILKFFFEKY